MSPLHRDYLTKIDYTNIIKYKSNTIDSTISLFILMFAYIILLLPSCLTSIIKDNYKNVHTPLAIAISRGNDDIVNLLLANRNIR